MFNFKIVFFKTTIVFFPSNSWFLTSVTLGDSGNYKENFGFDTSEDDVSGFPGKDSRHSMGS